MSLIKKIKKKKVKNVNKSNLRGNIFALDEGGRKF